MKPIQSLPIVFFLFGAVLLCASICPVFGKAPDTAKIVFASFRDGNREIYLMNPDGSQQVNITNHLAEDVYPVWSPTGEHILFVSNRDGVRDLYLMDADGGNVRKIFRKVAHRAHPTWSPDGKKIAYEKLDGAEWFIYTAEITGKQEQQIALDFKRIPWRIGLIQSSRCPFHRSRSC